MAVAAVRLDRNPATTAELRDALNARRNRRDAVLPPDTQARMDQHHAQQVRTYGRVEITF